MRCPPADAQRGVQQLFHLVVGIGSQRGDDGRADVGDAGDADVVPVVAHHAVAPEEGGVDASAAGRRGGSGAVGLGGGVIGDCRRRLPRRLRIGEVAYGHAVVAVAVVVELQGHVVVDIGGETRCLECVEGRRPSCPAAAGRLCDGRDGGRAAACRCADGNVHVSRISGGVGADPCAEGTAVLHQPRAQVVVDGGVVRAVVGYLARHPAAERRRGAGAFLAYFVAWQLEHDVLACHRGGVEVETAVQLQAHQYGGGAVVLHVTDVEGVLRAVGIAAHGVPEGGLLLVGVGQIVRMGRIGQAAVAAVVHVLAPVGAVGQWAVAVDGRCLHKALVAHCRQVAVGKASCVVVVEGKHHVAAVGGEGGTRVAQYVVARDAVGHGGLGGQSLHADVCGGVALRLRLCGEEVACAHLWQVEHRA